MRGLREAVCVVAALLLPACGPDEAPEVEVPAWAHVAPEQIAEAKKHGVPVAFENDLGMRFVLIPAGTFLMGSPEDEDGRRDDETQHEVTISQPFYMQTTEVDRRTYRNAFIEQGTIVMGYDDAALPISEVSRSEAQDFAKNLSRRDPVRFYRLPTEAEWEYACRAGTTTRFWWGDDVRLGARYANLIEASEALPSEDASPDRVEQPLPVSTLLPNPWGLYDVHGNVAEWVSDGYAPYEPDPVCDPVGPERSRKPVLRGGHANMPSRLTGAAYRDTPPSLDYKSPWDGFRLVSPLPEPGE